jgi:peptide/nickel transport system ATP-binding protein
MLTNQYMNKSGSVELADAETTSLLDVRAIGKTYRSRGNLGAGADSYVLRDFSVRFEQSGRQVIALVGESGSGKTTAGRIALGLLTPTDGDVLYLGRPIREMPRRERKQFRRDVQAVAQDPYSAFNPFYRVGHIFHLAQRKLRMYATKAEERDAIEEALGFVGLEERDILARYPHQLSGGERQRLMIARALFVRPRLIVADEPVSMVDANLRLQILEIIERVRSELGISLLYISHDLSTVYKIASDIIVLHNGEVVESGPAHSVITNPSHPYTQLLIDSTPSPDPTVRW